MIINLKQYATVLGLIGTIAMASAVLGATGDVLIEYRASTGQLPEDFGWYHEGMSLEEKCPLEEAPPTCEWYGARDRDEDPPDGAPDNDGAPAASDSSRDKESRGGNVDNTYPPTGTNNDAPADPFGGYDVNYPPEPLGVSGSTHYSEWIEFDDDGENLVHIDTNNGLPTPKGSQNFPGAPAYQTLRLVGADGNGIAGSLPAAGTNNRNSGKIKIKNSYGDGHVGPITVVIRAAFGERGTPDATSRFLEFDVPRAAGGSVRWSFYYLWDNGGFLCQPGGGSPCGLFGVVNDTSDGSATNMPGTGVTETQTFTTFRVACDPDVGDFGQCTIWVNEDDACQDILESSIPPDLFPPDGPGPRITSGGSQVRFGLIERSDYTMWVDYIQVLEGIVPPHCDPCLANDPVFDTTGPTAGRSDGKVDELDLDVFSTDCYTGPAPAIGAFDALSDECKCMDLNGDEAIDHEDFGRFQACYTGADGTLDTNCDD